MDLHPERQELIQLPEISAPAIEQEEAKHRGFKLKESFAEDSVDNGVIMPLIQEALQRYWNQGIPAFATFCTIDGGERRYCIFAKIPRKEISSGMGGIAVVGATVSVPPVPKINH